VTWSTRVLEHSPPVRRTQEDAVEQARQIVLGAQRLVAERGAAVSIQELARAGNVALQTFYRYFAGKDELFLAVVEETILGGCVALTRAAAAFADPIDRLHFYVTSALSARDGQSLAFRQFLTSEYYRLQQIYPAEMAAAVRPFDELITRELRAAAADRSLADGDAERQALFITRLVLGEFHHQAFAPDDGYRDQDRQALWAFCLRGLGAKGTGQASDADH
jgi:TetR/AcrR family transcriptional regulator